MSCFWSHLANFCKENVITEKLYFYIKIQGNNELSAFHLVCAFMSLKVYFVKLYFCISSCVFHPAITETQWTQRSSGFKWLERLVSHRCWCSVLRSSSQASSVQNCGCSLCSTGSVDKASPSKPAWTTSVCRGLLGNWRPDEGEHRSVMLLQGSIYCQSAEDINKQRVRGEKYTTARVHR